jgi:hypothetical protein
MTLKRSAPAPRPHKPRRAASSRRAQQRDRQDGDGSRAKQRRYRQRQRTGEAVYRVLVEPRVIWALIKRGMSEADSRNREAVSRELSTVLQQWAKHWVPE